MCAAGSRRTHREAHGESPRRITSGLLYHGVTFKQEFYVISSTLVLALAQTYRDEAIHSSSFNSYRIAGFRLVTLRRLLSLDRYTPSAVIDKIISFEKELIEHYYSSESFMDSGELVSFYD